MPFFIRENINFHYLDRGSGVPVVFQHGLGSDMEKIFALLDLPRGFRLLGMDCRAHGRTTPVGQIDKLRFDAFADDLTALMDQRQIARAVCGGTSMGAGVALNCALRHPQRVLGLALLRPAWLDQPNVTNVQLFELIAQLLREHGPDEGRELFRSAELYKSVARKSADSAESLLALFSDPRALETIARLEQIPQDAPNRDRTEWHQISVPTLVLATEHDPVHPFEYGEILAKEIPNAQLEALTPKSVNLAQYTSDLNRSLAAFLQCHFLC